MSMLKITPVVDVSVNIRAAAIQRGDFDTGLIMADSDASPRCTRITSTAELAELGFDSDSGLYRAASLYFAQEPKPTALVVGCRRTGESALDALRACRELSADFYGFYLCGELPVADMPALAQWAQESRCVYFYDVNEMAEDLQESVFFKLKAATMRSAFGLYSERLYAAAGAMGLAMGSAKRTMNSAFALSYKKITGISPDNLSEAEVSALKAVNANVYVFRGNAFSVLERGVMASGEPYDEVMGIDRLGSDIQQSVMELLSGTKTKIPHTDAGMLSFITAINGELEKSRAYGFIAPGTWTGETVLSLETGDPLETGYLVQAEPVSSQTRADREARKAPPIYACVKLAGAIEHVVIKIDVDR